MKYNRFKTEKYIIKYIIDQNNDVFIVENEKKYFLNYCLFESNEILKNVAYQLLYNFLKYGYIWNHYLLIDNESMIKEIFRQLLILEELASCKKRLEKEIR